MRNLINEALNERDDISLRLENRSLIDVDTISESVIRAAEYVIGLLSYGLPKSVYQLAIFNLLSRHGFKLEIQKLVDNGSDEDGRKKEIIIVNEVLVIECVVQSELIPNLQQRLMFDHDNNSEAGIIINFGALHTENSITRVYKNSVLH